MHTITTEPPERRSHWPLALTLGCAFALVTACGGGGGSSSADPPIIASAPPPPPATPPRTCDMQGFQGAYPACICPNGGVYAGATATVAGTCPPDPPVVQAPPTGIVQLCPIGQTCNPCALTGPLDGAWIGDVSASGIHTSSGGVCLAPAPLDRTGAPFICADTLDYSAMVTGRYMSIGSNGAWTSPTGDVRGPIWKWPIVPTTGELTGARTTVGTWPMSPGITQFIANSQPHWGRTWSLGFAFTDSPGFDTVPSPMERFTPVQSLVGSWPNAFCNRVACGLSVGSDGLVSAQDSAGCVYSGTLTGDLTSVAQATITDCTGAVYIGAAVVTPRAASSTMTDWGDKHIVILGASGATGELVISNVGVPRVPCITSLCVSGPPPTLSFTASPSTVAVNGFSTLTWASADATSCIGTAGFPQAGTLTPYGFLQTPDLSATTLYTLTCSNAGGNTTASVTITVGTSSPPGGPPPTACTPPDVLIAGTCQPAPVISVALALDHPTVVDSSLGCPSPAGESCLASVTWSAVSSLTGDAFVCSYLGGELNPAIGLSVGPFPAAQDGLQIIGISCADVYGQIGTASAPLQIIPPSGPPTNQDTFAGVDNGGIETLTWHVLSTTAGCEVHEFNTNGLETVLSPAGITSGSASSGFMSPSYAPFTFVIECPGGTPNANVQTVTVTNP